MRLVQRVARNLDWQAARLHVRPSGGRDGRVTTFSKDELAQYAAESKTMKLGFGACWWCLNVEHRERPYYFVAQLLTVGNRFTCKDHLQEAREWFVRTTRGYSVA